LDKRFIAIAMAYALGFALVTAGGIENYRLRQSVKYYKALWQETEKSEAALFNHLKEIENQPEPVSEYPVRFSFLAKCDGGYARFTSFPRWKENAE
jgi:hypothetical protein